MDTTLKLSILLAVTSVNAGLIAVAPKILEGPSSRTLLIGPDGSQISAIIPGGKIVIDGLSGPLLQGAPEVVAIPSIAHPIPAVATLPVATEIKTDTSIPVETPSVSTETKTDAETVSVDAESDVVVAKSIPENVENVTESKATTVEVEVTTVIASTEASKVASGETLQIVESSSTNSTSNETLSETSSTSGIDASKAVEVSTAKTVDSPLVLSYGHDSSWFAPEYSSLEGQYVPDNLEKLFDDGAYKPGDFKW